MLPTILLTAYGQLVMKWRVGFLAHKTPFEGLNLLARIKLYFTDPYVLSAYLFAFLAGFFWIYVLEKYPVSVAFPSYMGIIFVIVLIGSTVFLHESLSTVQLVGIGLISLGIFLATRGV